MPVNLFLLLCLSICERVTPRLSHANSAVVLSAVKVLMKFLELLPKDSDYYNMLLKKLAPPLVTLLSGEPEVQYVALRNINLIVQKRYGLRGVLFLGCQRASGYLRSSDISTCTELHLIQIQIPQGRD